MKYWDDEFIETRDILDHEFMSPITTPALKGSVRDTDGNVVGLYEFEIIKEPCALTERIDHTNETINDMCIQFEYRLMHPNGLPGVVQTTQGPIPVDEMTQELQDILINAHLLM